MKRLRVSRRVERVDFGSLRRLDPVSADFGYERGRPVDRYYIERFLSTRAYAIRGRVLEFGVIVTPLGGDKVSVEGC